MQYHALSCANAGFQVDLVGFGGENVEEHEGGWGGGGEGGGGVLGPSYGLGSKAIPFFRINFLPFPD